MKRMSQIQPLMQEINEKYKNEPKKKQEAIVRLYKEHKVNPLGGCLPILFQMPVFFAIYPIFRAIELRGAPFIWWIKDLSCPDTVATLPTAIPFYGNQVNVLPILYAISLFVQQKIMVKDPKQKAMVYIMPIFLLLLLNKWSSGFILYWFIFNLLSILQRYIVKDKEEPKPETSHAPLPVKSLVNKFSKKSKK
jgi:YidC/Oxa1 family membrane protein insertase